MGLLLGDCLEHMRALAPNYVDAIVTDPPYGLSFMGKKWDYDVPSTDVWKEALRVLKPGGHLLAFGGTRTYHRLVVAIEDAGFEIRDQVQWIYGQGFPKSLDISKAIDKAAGAEREIGPIDPSRAGRLVNQSADYSTEAGWSAGNRKVTIDPPATDSAKQWEGWGTALKPANEPICLARKPLEKGLTVAANVLKHGTGGINIDASRILSDQTRGDKASQRSENRKGNNRCALCGVQKTNSSSEEPAVTAENVQLQQSLPLQIKERNEELELEGRRLVEVGRLPRDSSKEPDNTGTQACNGNETGAATKAERGSTSHKPHESGQSPGEPGTCRECRGPYYETSLPPMPENRPVASSSIGRFPSNVLMDERAGEMLDAQTGFLAPSGNKRPSEGDAIYGSAVKTRTIPGVNSYSAEGGGGASRFFYCAKASTSERNAGLEGMPEKLPIPQFQTMSDPRMDKPQQRIPRSNFHPTVKPVKLMEYLCRLITPPGGIVLDPFMGSGTTGLAAKNLGLDFIGIELNAEYFEIASKRVGG